MLRYGIPAYRLPKDILDNEIDKSVYNEIDCFWMDAGWYSYNEGWYDGVGNWTVDTSRYDNGISDYVEEVAADNAMTSIQTWSTERMGRDREDKPEYKVKINASLCFSKTIHSIESFPLETSPSCSYEPNLYMSPTFTLLILFHTSSP